MSGFSNASKLSLAVALMDGESAAAPRPEAVHSVTSVLAGRSRRRSGGLALQRKCASCGSQGVGLSDTCQACESEERMGAAGLLPKFTAIAPGDRYEQEADRTADQMLRTGSIDAIAPRNSPLVQRQETSKEEDAGLQAKSSSTGLNKTSSDPGFARMLSAETAGGAPLTSQARAFFEPRFGRDLGTVRIHTGGRAESLNRKINARAFTRDQHVYFGPGQYDAGTTEGRRLIAHELTHTLQQGGVAPLSRSASAPAPNSPPKSMIQRAPCPSNCSTCPPSGRVKEDCECFGLKNPGQVIQFTKTIKIVRLDGGKGTSGIKNQVKDANETWNKAGIEVVADLKEIPREDTQKLLGRNSKGKPNKTVILSPLPDGSFQLATRSILGLTPIGQQLSVTTGATADSFVVYYVPQFDNCGGVDKAVGCALEGVLAFPGSRGIPNLKPFSIFIEKKSQSSTLAHELGHMWINKSPDDHEVDEGNVMHKASNSTGLTAEQIKMARASLGLGPMRCVPAGANASAVEGIRQEQQRADLNPVLEAALRLDKFGLPPIWRGEILVNGKKRVSTLKASVVAPRRLNIRYTYQNKYGEDVFVPSKENDRSVTNARTEEGRIKFDWKEGSTSGKASLKLVGTDRLEGSWGTGDSDSNGGTWMLTKES